MGPRPIMHRPAGSYAPGRLRWGPSSPRPARRMPVELYRQRISGVPLVGGQGQATISAGTTVGTPIKVVQSAIIPNALSGSFTSPTTAGNCVIVAVVAFSGGAAPSVSGVTLGGVADNFAAVASGVNGAATFLLASCWADPNCAGGQTAVVVSGSNLTVSTSSGIILLEVSGLATGSVTDQTSTGNSNSSASWSSGTTATTAQAYEFWVGVNATANGATQPGSPWTQLVFPASVGEGMGYQIVTATGTATYAGTQSPAGQYGALVGTLKKRCGSKRSGSFQSRVSKLVSVWGVFMNECRSKDTPNWTKGEPP